MSFLRLATPLLVAVFLSGCADEKPKMIAGPTYYQDMAPLLDKHCVTCHTEGGIAPFPLDAFEHARAYAVSMAARTHDRVMPPFNADNSGECNQFQHARWLSEKEIATFAAWEKGGMVKGTQVERAAAPDALELDHVSVTLDMGKAYTPDESFEDDYRCFVIDPKINAQQFITGYAVRPGQAKDVHHMILYATNSTEASRDAEQKNTATGGNGYPCFGGAGVKATMVAGWAPGSEVTRYPAGTGIPIESGRKLIMQIHYHPQSDIKPDRTEVDLQLENTVDHEMTIVGLSDPASLLLRPGEKEEKATATLSLAQTVPFGGINLLGVFPHMHKLGTRLKVEIENGAEGDQCLVDIPRWNFDWQQLFLYDKPIRIGKQGTVKLTCTYDTTSRTDVVKWGEGTADEMCINFFFVTAPYAF